MLILVRCYLGVKVLVLCIGMNDIKYIISIIHILLVSKKILNGILIVDTRTVWKKNDSSPTLEQISHYFMLKYRPLNSSQKHFTALKVGLTPGSKAKEVEYDLVI